MLRGVIILGALAGAGWYAYRKVTGGATGPVPADGPARTGDRSAAAGDLSERVTRAVSQAATTARQAATTAASKARAAVPGGGGATVDQPPSDREMDGAPPEARAAAMAAMPAFQQPPPFPDASGLPGTDVPR